MSAASLGARAVRRKALLVASYGCAFCSPRCPQFATSSTPRRVISLSIFPALLFPLLIAAPARPAPITYTFSSNAEADLEVFPPGNQFETVDISGTFVFDPVTNIASMPDITVAGHAPFGDNYQSSITVAQQRTIDVKNLIHPLHPKDVEITFLAPLGMTDDPILGVIITTMPDGQIQGLATNTGGLNEVTGFVSPSVTPPVPEPSSATLPLTGVLGLLGCGVLLRSRCTQRRRSMRNVKTTTRVTGLGYGIIWSRRMHRMAMWAVVMCAMSSAARAQYTLQTVMPLVAGTAVGQAQQGYSVAISANQARALVGGPADNGGAGAAWEVNNDAGQWRVGTKLLASDIGTCPGGPPKSQQGYSVALSADGNTSLVGGPFDCGQTLSGTPVLQSGAAWVFNRSKDTGSWDQGTKLVGSFIPFSCAFPMAMCGAKQGSSVALSADGNTALVGGPDDNGGIGAAWVFARPNNISPFMQQFKLFFIGATGSSGFGHSVALSADGNTALVGGPQDNGGVGAAWVFSTAAGGFNQQGPKVIGSGAMGSVILQGVSVALSADGNTAIVGGAADSSHTGAAWVFSRSNGVWLQQGPKLVGTGVMGSTADQGMSVALLADGNTAFIGGPSDNGGAGAVWVFTRNGGVATACSGVTDATSAFQVTRGGYHFNNATQLFAQTDMLQPLWTQLGQKRVAGQIINMSFVPGRSQGYSVAAQNDWLFVGGPFDNGGTGAAWVWFPSGPLPSQQLPVSLVLDNLSANAALSDKTGNTTCAGPLGSPYINVPAGSNNVLLLFADPNQTGITYNTRLLAGSGTR